MGNSLVDAGKKPDKIMRVRAGLYDFIENNPRLNGLANESLLRLKYNKLTMANEVQRGIRGVAAEWRERAGMLFGLGAPLARM